MSESSGTAGLNVHLDILGQQPLLNIYTQICLCFPMADEASSHLAIINILTNGLEKLSASFPWIAGKVINEESGQGNSGIFKIKSLDKNIQRLVVKDLRHDPSAPTMDALRPANFPFSMLDENIIAPRKTLPGNRLGGKPESDPISPVFMIQANFITGGLVLTFVGQHNTMDMTGQGHLIHLFSKACHDEYQFTSEELSSGNRDRRNVIPLLADSYKQDSELSHHISNTTNDQPAPASAPALPTPPKCKWAYFNFNQASLSALKALASKTITLPSVHYISTDDALSSFIWKSVIRARLPRVNPIAQSTFARAVDVRPYLDVSNSYPGLMQNMTYHTSSVKKLAEEPLGSVASKLRSALDMKTSDLIQRTRALATLINRTPDKSTISFTNNVDQSLDIMLSSWAKINCYELDFNLGLGKPEAVRRPQFDTVENLIYLMPRTLDGDIAVALCLRDEDMERLRTDKEFAKYGKYIE